MKHCKPITHRPSLALDDFWWNLRKLLETLLPLILQLATTLSPLVGSKEPEEQA